MIRSVLFITISVGKVGRIQVKQLKNQRIALADNTLKDSVSSYRIQTVHNPYAIFVKMNDICKQFGQYVASRLVPNRPYASRLHIHSTATFRIFSLKRDFFRLDMQLIGETAQERQADGGGQGCVNMTLPTSLWGNPTQIRQVNMKRLL